MNQSQRADVLSVIIAMRGVDSRERQQLIAAYLCEEIRELLTNSAAFGSSWEMEHNYDGTQARERIERGLKEYDACDPP